MSNLEINKRDHNYSESKPQHANNGTGTTISNDILVRIIFLICIYNA